MSKAPEAELSDLHGTLARTMRTRLESGEATAADLNAIRQFLKDNGISCEPGTNPDLNTAQDLLADIPVYDDPPALPHQ